MARGVTLERCLQSLRFEIGDSPSESQGKNVREKYIHALKREQERLYDEYDWPFLRVTRDKVTSAGQRYYDFPDDLNLDRIDKVEFQWSGSWIPVERGILTTDYTSFDSDADERADPVQKWDIRDAGSGEQMEIWPIPLTDGSATTERLRITGVRTLDAFVAESDRCDLDDMAIYLQAAAEILAADGNPKAPIILKKAQDRLKTIRGRSRAGRRVIMGGGGQTDSRRPPELRVSYVRDAT